MSRFFEILTEASRAQPPGDGIAQNEKAEEAGPSVLDSLPIFDLPPVAVPPVPVEPVEPVAAPERVEPPRLELPALDFLDRLTPQKNGFLAKSVKVFLDPKVPLLPHSIDHSVVEQYRRLRTKIQQQRGIQALHSLLVASPGPGEGKTLTTMNLGLSFAMLPSFKVLVIDGDLRKKTVAKWLGVPHLPGLSNVIEGSAQAHDVVFKCEELPLHFMVSGTSTRPAAELLNSTVLGGTIRRMTEDYDLVLMDSPPVNLIADAQMLANSCDGVLLVARPLCTTTKAFQKMLQDLLPFRIIGTILNAGIRAQRYHRYDDY